MQDYELLVYNLQFLLFVHLFDFLQQVELGLLQVWKLLAFCPLNAVDEFIQCRLPDEGLQAWVQYNVQVVLYGLRRYL